MSIKDIVKALGGDQTVAKLIDRRPVSVRNYVRDGYFPHKHHPVLIKRGKEVGLDLTTHDLDPMRT